MKRKAKTASTANRTPALSVKKSPPKTNPKTSTRRAQRQRLAFATIQQALNAVASRVNNIPRNVNTALKPLMQNAYDPANVNRPFVYAYDDRTDYTSLYRLQDKRFQTMGDLDRFQRLFMRGSKTLSQDIRNLETKWTDIYYNPLVQFMGDRDLWNALGIHVPYEDFKPTALLRLPVTRFDVAYFSGMHWVSRKAGTKEVFDPYNEFQIPGTNQFCQTYAMMYLLGDRLGFPLRRNGNSGNWLKYYTYTNYALKFIQRFIEFCKKSPKIKSISTFTKHKDTTFKNLEAAVKVCLAHPYMCLNVAPLPLKELR